MIANGTITCHGTAFNIEHNFLNTYGLMYAKIFSKPLETLTALCMLK